MKSLYAVTISLVLAFALGHLMGEGWSLGARILLPFTLVFFAWSINVLLQVEPSSFGSQLCFAAIVLQAGRFLTLMIIILGAGAVQVESAGQLTQAGMEEILEEINEEGHRIQTVGDWMVATLIAAAIAGLFWIVCQIITRVIVEIRTRDEAAAAAPDGPELPTPVTERLSSVPLGIGALAGYASGDINSSSDLAVSFGIFAYIGSAALSMLGPS